MIDFDDLTTDEVDEQNQRLLEDLRTMYPVRAKVAQPLERVRQRLFYADVSKVSTSASQSRLPQPKQTRKMNSRYAQPGFRSSIWYHKLNVIAAAVFVTLLVGSFISLLTLTRFGGIGASPRTQVPIQYVRMLSETIGWAVCVGGVILRTTDGGTHWQDVSPLLSQDNIYWEGSDSAFLGATTAVIAFTANQTTPEHFQPMATSFVLRTNDGGHTWQKSTIQTNGNLVYKITFINPQQGWILTRRGESIHQVIGPEHIAPPDLFRTTDGGKTWVKVLSTKSPDALSFNDLAIAGVRFANATTGWIAGDPVYPVQTAGRLYMTHDGGYTWQEQPLALSQTMQNCVRRIEAPQFFSARDGILSLTCPNPAGIEVYATHDGGVTWKSTAFLPFTLPTTSPSDVASIKFATVGATPVFIDMNHGWVEGFDASGKTLFATNDGGQHWTKVATVNDPAPNSVNTPDFTSEKVGWIFDYTFDSKSNSQSSALFKTADGGHSWIQVHAMFPIFIVPKSAF